MNNNILKLTSFNKHSTQNFATQLEIFLKKTKIFLKKKGDYSINKKYTILRSPHVHKKARDQLQVKHITTSFYISKKFNWSLFFYFLNKQKTTTIKLEYQQYKKQILYFFFY